MNTNFKEIEKKIVANGWILVRVNGSHYQYKKINNFHTITIPNHNSNDLSISIIENLEIITGLSLKR